MSCLRRLLHGTKADLEEKAKQLSPPEEKEALAPEPYGHHHGELNLQIAGREGSRFLLTQTAQNKTRNIKKQVPCISRSDFWLKTFLAFYYLKLKNGLNISVFPVFVGLSQLQATPIDDLEVLLVTTLVIYLYPLWVLKPRTCAATARTPGHNR